MKTKLGVLIVFLAAALAPASTLRSSSATEDGQTNNLTALLQQGLFEEQANRNLDAAISDYQTLAAQFDKDRSLAATAIFRLGECYRAQGRTNEAAAQYQRILREFPDQQTLATLSRQNLTGMGVGPAPATASENTDAQLWDRVKNLPQDRLEKVLPTLVPDTVLTSLLQQRNEAQTQRATLVVNYATNHFKVHEKDVLLSELNRQIDEKISGMMQALKLRAEVSHTPAVASAPTDDEDQEIRRIQEMIQDSPDLINGDPLWRAAGAGELRVVMFLLDHGANINAMSDGETPLISAANSAQKTMVELLLNRGADVNARDASGGTALLAATRAGYQAVVEVLLARKADVNMPYTKMNNAETPLHLAAERGFANLVSLFLANGADANATNDDGRTPLHLAAESGRGEIVQMLLHAGANPNVADNRGRTPLSYAAERGSPEMVKTLLGAGANPNVEDAHRTPLSFATENGSPEMIKSLLAAKADPDGGGKLDAPLLCAIHKNDAVSAGLLLRGGANPNLKGIVDQNFRRNGYNQATPLWLAVSMNQLPMVQPLLKYKADPNDSQIDGAPMIFAALPHLDILAALLDAGADPNPPVSNPAGGYASTPPLMAAIGNSFYETLAGNLAAAKLLLAHGANPNAKNRDGDTALHWAVNLAFFGRWALDPENRLIVKLLLDHNADPNVRNQDGKTPLDILKDRLASTSASPEQKALARQLADLLRQHGALDVLPDWGHITVSRPPANYSTTIFYKGTNGWNRFTLYDLLGVQYDLLTASPGSLFRIRDVPYESHAAANSLAFPDFSRIIIHRPSARGTNWSELKINLARALDSGDCAADVPLCFGDVVEIPEADHVINEPWKGLSTNALFTLESCLTRHLQITVNGQTTNITVAPQVWALVPGSSEYPLSSWGAKMLPAVGLLKFEPFMLWPVLENSKLLLASSDLSRVVVKRRNAATGKAYEWTVDCSNPNAPPDFWLRDGDVIEVPEKP